jgi:hypothetical protein
LAKRAVSTGGDAQSFDRLRDRLTAIADPVAPLLEPRPVALRALVVADCLTQPDLLRKLPLVAEAGVCDLRWIEELREAAKAVLFFLTKVGQPSVEQSVRAHEAIRDAAKVTAIRWPRSSNTSSTTSMTRAFGWKCFVWARMMST